MAHYRISVFDYAGTVLASPEIGAPSDTSAADYAKARLTVYSNAARVTVRRATEDHPFATFEKENDR